MSEEELTTFLQPLISDKVQRSLIQEIISLSVTCANELDRPLCTSLKLRDDLSQFFENMGDTSNLSETERIVVSKHVTAKLLAIRSPAELLAFERHFLVLRSGGPDNESKQEISSPTVSNLHQLAHQVHRQIEQTFPLAHPAPVLSQEDQDRVAEITELLRAIADQLSEAPSASE